MKKLVVYYSLEGNTKLVAETIARTAQADILELVPERQPSTRGVTRFLWGGRSALMAHTPELAPYSADPEDYDLIFLGTPVWAWTLTPPLRSFLQKHCLTGKKVALFCCHGGGPGKIFKRMKKAVPESLVLGEIGIRDPLKFQTEIQIKMVEKWAEDILGKA